MVHNIGNTTNKNNTQNVKNEKINPIHKTFISALLKVLLSWRACLYIAKPYPIPRDANDMTSTVIKPVWFIIKCPATRWNPNMLNSSIILESSY